MLPDGTIFDRSYFQDLLDHKGSSEFGLGRHLKQEALSCKGQDRQTVSNSLNLLSNATADLSDHLYPNDSERSKVTAYVRVMANLHLVMSSNRDDEQPKKLHSPFGY